MKNGCYSCLCVPKFLCYWMLVCLCMWTYIFAYVLAYIFTYLRILILTVDGKGLDKGRECDKGRVGEVEGNGLLQMLYHWYWALFNNTATSGHLSNLWGCRMQRLHLCRGVRPPPMSVLDMTLNSLMVRFQWCWYFEEWGVPLHCYCSQVHSGLVWLHLIRPYLWVKYN